MFKTSKLVISPRVRKSPYFDSTIKYGAQAFTVYNHMYLPIAFEGPEEDYKKLLKLEKNNLLNKDLIKTQYSS